MSPGIDGGCGLVPALWVALAYVDQPWNAACAAGRCWMGAALLFYVIGLALSGVRGAWRVMNSRAGGGTGWIRLSGIGTGGPLWNLWSPEAQGPAVETAGQGWTLLAAIVFYSCLRWRCSRGRLSGSSGPPQAPPASVGSAGWRGLAT